MFSFDDSDRFDITEISGSSDKEDNFLVCISGLIESVLKRVIVGTKYENKLITYFQSGFLNDSWVEIYPKYNRDACITFNICLDKFGYTIYTSSAKSEFIDDRAKIEKSIITLKDIYDFLEIEFTKLFVNNKISKFKGWKND